jgi:LPS-assembly protein
VAGQAPFRKLPFYLGKLEVPSLGSGSLMKNRLLAALLVCCVPLISQAQLDDFGDVPVQITADGETRFEGGVAVAEQNVIIEYGDTHILADYAQYSPETREVLLRGHVRIYRSDFNFTGERAVYNLETKKLRAADFGGAAEPFYFSGESVTSLTSRAFQVRNALFTTHDSAQPDYHFRARSVRIYRDDRIIFSNVTLFVGQTPVFWWPYLYQSLREDMSFTLTPGYNSRWGAFLLTQFTFPVAENVAGRIRLDLRSERGVAGGLDLDYRFGKDNRSYGSFQAYFAGDSGSDINKTGLKREDVDSGRYRISLQQRTYVTDDIYANFDINALSDRRMLEDFFPSEFTLDPQPDNVISVVKTHENYTITLLTRAQVNDFQDTTERLPELVADFKRQNLFGSDIFYEGETGAAFLRRRFGDGDENVRFLSTGTTRPTPSGYTPPVPLPKNVLRLALAHSAHRIPRNVLWRYRPDRG